MKLLNFDLDFDFMGYGGLEHLLFWSAAGV